MEPKWPAEFFQVKDTCVSAAGNTSVCGLDRRLQAAWNWNSEQDEEAPGLQSHTLVWLQMSYCFNKNKFYYTFYNNIMLLTVSNNICFIWLYLKSPVFEISHKYRLRQSWDVNQNMKSMLSWAETDVRLMWCRGGRGYSPHRPQSPGWPLCWVKLLSYPSNISRTS